MDDKTFQISASEVKKLLDKARDVVLVDVRTVQEFTRGHIEGSINIPLDELSKIKEVVSKEKTIITYCLSGSRSGEAVKLIRKMGFSNARSMVGGLLGWRIKGYPLKTL